MKTLEEIYQEKFFEYLNKHRSTSYIDAMTLARIAIVAEHDYWVIREEADRETHAGEVYGG